MNRAIKNSAYVAASLIVAFSTPSVAQNATQPKFSLPLDCTVNKDCWVQNLVDFNEKNKIWQDPFCGTATFDKHKGTDFRVRFVDDLKRNIPVLAMADGKVAGLRNDMGDHLVQNVNDVRKIQGKECGNGSILLHKNGWNTQYCHLKKGSLTVKKGDTVKRGDVIGIMGLSGHTTFPHVHVTFRKGKTVIDPMTGKDRKTQCSPDEKIGRDALWDTKALRGMNGASTAILGTGFSGGVVKTSTILTSKTAKPTRKGPLVFWAYFINLRPNDRIDLRIKSGDDIYVETLGKALTKPRASYAAYTGRKRALKKGSSYTGEAVLWRDGKIIQTVTSQPVRF